LAKIMVRLRWDMTYPGDAGGTVKRHSGPPCPITTTDVDDALWIPRVAAQGWAIISRDSKIERRPAEGVAVRDNGAKLFALASDEKLDVWHLEILMCNWRAIDRLADAPGPYIYRVTRTKMTKLL
ncbi:MAG: hypothetical protein ACRDJF_08610, partial [Actinomycetota bacterium]